MAQGRGAVCDFSSTGCFVLSGGSVNGGELVRVEIYFENGTASLWGEVVYSIAEMGFAIRFKFTSDNERAALEKLIEDASETEP